MPFLKWFTKNHKSHKFNLNNKTKLIFSINIDKIDKLNIILEKYNNNIFNIDNIVKNINKLKKQIELPITGGSLNNQNELVKPFNNSFFSNNNKQNLLSNFFESETKIKHLIIGGEPNGLYLGNKLSEIFPNHIIIVVDSRIEVEHKRKPFSRKRIIASKNKPINEIELEEYNKLKTKQNVKFLYTKKSMIDIINNINNNIKFVYDTTGGRLQELLNPLWNNISIKNIIITKDDNNIYTYNKTNGEHFICNSNERFLIGTIENILSISQNDSIIEFLIVGDVDNEVIKKIKDNSNFTTISELKTFIDENIANKYVIMFYDEFIENVNIFDNDKPFTLTIYSNQFKISKHKPCALHIKGYINFVKFDLGESLFTLPIAAGSNINSTRDIITKNLIPLLKKIQDYFIPISNLQNAGFYKSKKHIKNKKFNKTKKYNSYKTKNNL